MNVEEILNTAGKLSPSVQILPKLLKLLGDPDSSLSDVEAVIKLDTTLTAEIIRVSNSSFYGGAESCKSIDQSVNRIGFADVHRIVGALAAKQVFDCDLPLHKLDSQQIWERSVKSGVIMHALSNRFGLNPDTMYTIGLLHTVGMVVMNQYFLNTGSVDYSEAKYPEALTPEEERNLFGCDNDELGARLLENWKFPPEISEPVRYQAKPNDSMSCKMASCLLYVSNAVVSHLAEEHEGEDVYSKFTPDPLVLESLGISADDIVSEAMESESTFEWLMNSV